MCFPQHVGEENDSQHLERVRLNIEKYISKG